MQKRTPESIWFSSFLLMGRTSELAPLAKNLHSLSSWDPKAHPLFLLVSAQISLSLLAARVCGIRALSQDTKLRGFGGCAELPHSPACAEFCVLGRERCWMGKLRQGGVGQGGSRRSLLLAGFSCEGWRASCAAGGLGGRVWR